MRPITTFVLTFHSLHVCVLVITMSTQKPLNRSKWRLEVRLTWAQWTIYSMGVPVGATWRIQLNELIDLYGGNGDVGRRCQWRRNYGERGVHCTHQVQDLPPRVRDAAYVKIVSKWLTTRVCNVRTNLYSPLAKRFRRTWSLLLL